MYWSIRILDKVNRCVFSVFFTTHYAVSVGCVVRASYTRITIAMVSIPRWGMWADFPGRVRHDDDRRGR